ncbi:MAG: peptidoglycan DD-metalloendopeptidase family protein [Candidatus Accumulibacter sp.]|jgi:lipoprotein NlpD|nr:peptidoglycan DD-metalloendopeptidase family protein [Accumulibacter sp.]
MKKNGSFPGVGTLALVILALGLSACASKSPAPVAEPSGQMEPTQSTVTTYTVKSGDTLYSIAREHNLDFRELIALNAIENPDQLAVGRVLRVRPLSDPAAPGVATTAPVSSDDVVVRPIGGAPVVGQRPDSGGKPDSGGNTDKLKREPKAGKEPYSDQALAAARSGGQPTPAPTPTPTPKPDESPVAKPPAAAGGNALPWIWPASGKIVATFSENGNKGVDIAGKAGDPVIAAGDGKVVYSGTGLRGYGKLVIIKHDATYLTAYAHNQNILVKEGQSVNKGQRIAEMGNTDADQVKLHFEVRRRGTPVDPLKYLPPR